MTWTPSVNLTIDMEPKTAKKKYIRREVASIIVITGCLERATQTSPSSYNIKVIPRTAAKKPRQHMPSNDHTREQPTTPTLMTSITKGNIQDLHRPCPSQTTTKRPSSSPPGLTPPQLRLQRNQATHGRPPRTRPKKPTTKVHAATRAPLNSIIVAKQKPAPHLSKPCGEDATTHGEDVLQDNAPKEKKHTRTPSSPDPKDRRFPFGAQAVGRRSTPL
ncbi:hypothetical protein ZWY2020_006681 [Hordeum vulgare]|nr:hypothetical protein ZWY2020_006681 [Hordeum vulgare]